MVEQKVASTVLDRGNFFADAFVIDQDHVHVAVRVKAEFLKNQAHGSLARAEAPIGREPFPFEILGSLESARESSHTEGQTITIGADNVEIFSPCVGFNQHRWVSVHAEVGFPLNQKID